MSIPTYTDPVDPKMRTGSASLPAVPPFAMKNVTCRAFPLKANMATLNTFCDQYLNMDIPAEIVHFRPGLPYVYLLVLDYGSMSPEAIQVQNLGWVAQDEVLFMMPLQRWRKEAGRMVFKDWACVSPFIFVDDAMSQRTGREVYGWPKVLGSVEAEVPLWSNDPRSPTSLFKLSVDVFTKAYAGRRQKPQTLIEIRQEPRPSFATIPPDADNPWGIFSILSNAVNATVGLSFDAMDMLAGMRARGYRTNRTPTNLLGMTSALGSYLSLLLPSYSWIPRGMNERIAQQGRVRQLSIEQITLKQFQDAAKPIEACYQALVGSHMSVDRLNAAGLLGDVNLLRGDPSGGFSVHIHRYDSQPIIESLGLDVHAQTEDADGSRVSVLKPTFPFWSDVDLNYGAGHVMCSRIPPIQPGAEIKWRDASGKDTDSAVPSKLSHIPFNTALGAATQTVSGPLNFPDMTIQVFPLLADKSKLQGCIDRYVNEALKTSHMRFEALGSYAYLIVNLCGDEHGTMWSESNNIGWWAEREVSFCIPVKWYEKGQLKSLAMVAPFVFSSNDRATLTDREINGRPSVDATIECPPDTWFDKPSGPNTARRLLKLTTEIFPALNLGQRSEQRTLIEIDATHPLSWNDSVGWRLVAEGWGAELASELKRLTLHSLGFANEVKQAKAVALEILACEQPINWINVKQYRATEDPTQACYQAVIHTTRRITQVYDIREIRKPININLYRYPGQPIAQTLGLKIKSTDSAAGDVIQHLQPIRPFWMRVSISNDLGTVLCWRSGGEIVDNRDASADTYFGRAGYTRAVRGWGEPGYRTERLSYVKEDDRPRPPRPADSTPSLREALIEELRHIRHIKQGEPAGQSDELERLKEASSAEAFAESLTIEELYQATEAIIAAIQKFEFESQRVSRLQAEAAIEAVDEVQIVLESILSSEWGNDDPTRKQLPELCIRADTIGLVPSVRDVRKDEWIDKHGLTQLDDDRSEWVTFDPEK